MKLKPISDIPSLSEQAYKRIREAILSLEVKPGELLVFGNLAEQLGVSRTPVRDALLRLETDGLVTIIPQRGASVLDITERDIDEIFEIRMLMESYAAKQAISSFTEQDILRLEEIIKEGEEAFNQNNHDLCAQLERQIHEKIIERYDNRWMTNILDSLELHYIRIRHIASNIPGRVARSHAQHIAIVEAFVNRDPEKAEKAMANHLNSVREEILENMDVLESYLKSSIANFQDFLVEFNNEINHFG